MNPKIYKYPFSLFRYAAPVSIILFLGLAYYFFFFLSGISRLIIGILFLYKATNDSLTLFISVTSGPESLWVEGKLLVVKPRFGKERRLDLEALACIKEIVWLDYVHSHSIIMQFGGNLGNIYLHRGLVDLKGLLEEILRVNPGCKVEGKYLESLLQGKA